jgi:hypothetical protein
MEHNSYPIRKFSRFNNLLLLRPLSRLRLLIRPIHKCFNKFEDKYKQVRGRGIGRISFGFELLTAVNMCSMVFRVVTSGGKKPAICKRQAEPLALS